MSNQGKIVQIIGAVVDVEFPRESVPRVYDALKVENTAITLEVQQQLGDGIVRTIALGSTDGLKRNLIANNTGKGISVPVGIILGPAILIAQAGYLMSDPAVPSSRASTQCSSLNRAFSSPARSQPPSKR